MTVDARRSAACVTAAYSIFAAILAYAVYDIYSARRQASVAALAPQHGSAADTQWDAREASLVESELSPQLQMSFAQEGTELSDNDTGPGEESASVVEEAAPAPLASPQAD